MDKKTAQGLVADAQAALAEMKTELKEAKKMAADLYPDKHYDLSNPSEMTALKERYQGGLKVHVIDDPSSKQAQDLMTRMYGLYEKIFPLEEEREEYAKLLELMGKNHDQKLQASGAAFKEQWIVVEDAKGEIVAARNTITFAANRDPKVAPLADGTQHLIYGFVDPRFRSLGLGDFTMDIAEQEARKFIGAQMKKPIDKVDFVQISEQNAPLKMSAESICVDTAGAKTDQFWRRDYYESLGFRELGFDYVQLPLEPREDGGEPCRDLNLITRGVPGAKSERGMQRVLTEVPAQVVGFHLYNFFDRSVAAGQYDVESDPDWVKQSLALQGGNLAVKGKLDFQSMKDQTWDKIREMSTAEGRFNSKAFSDKSIGEILGVTEIPKAGAEAKAQAAAPAKQSKFGR